MPKKSKNLVDLTPRYYVYYDQESKQILAVTNYKNLDFTNEIEIDVDCYTRFIEGKDKFEDFRIGTVIGKTGDASLGVISYKLSADKNFKNKLLTWIEGSTESSDISIVWDENNQYWMFNPSKNLRQRYFNNEIPATDISFFIILGNDPNFLIRTITINLKKLIENFLVVKFETIWERTIESISITSNITDLVSELTVWKANEN